MKNWLISMCFFLAPLAPAQLNTPKASRYTNPYELMFAQQLEFEQHLEWWVYANRDTAQVLSEPAFKDGAKHLGTTRFLERFRVLARDRHFLKAKSQMRDLQGWIDMRALIMTPASIANPQSQVRLKSFYRIVIDPEAIEPEERGLNRLRFRKGPGPGQDSESGDGRYQFLSSRSEVATVSTVVSYVFGVHFKQGDLDQYRNSANYRNADYFLVGDIQSIQPHDIQKQVSTKSIVIRGWIPASGTVLWDTRQALERVAGKPDEAHIFKDRKQLLSYFSQDAPSARTAFLQRFSKDIVRDPGVKPRLAGQSLRPIILGRERHDAQLNLVSEEIGFSGLASQGKQMSILADLQEGAQHLDLCFLTDATRSMEPCLKAAAEVSRTLAQALGKHEFKTKIHAAIYRDRADGVHHYRQYGGQGTVAAWLDRVKPLSSPSDRDYRESLFTGIATAVKDWHFSHPYSMRVMVILGDVGDKGDGPGQPEITNLLRQKKILPLAIRFNHPPTNPGNLSAVNQEAEAATGFLEDLTSVFKGVYGPAFEMDPRLGVAQLSAQGLAQNLRTFITQKAEALSTVIGEMREIRMGMSDFVKLVCSDAFPKNKDLARQCGTCTSKPALLSFLAKHRGQMAQKSNPGLIVTYLDQLKTKDFEAWKLVFDKPEMGFQKGFVALRQSHQYFTRPVLLLAMSEAKLLYTEYGALLSKRATCEERLFRETLVRAMSLIIGEPFAVQPNLVSRKKFRDWLFMAVDAQRAIFGNQEVIETKIIENRLCENPLLWQHFLKSVEKGHRFLDQLINPTNEIKTTRLYRDLQNYKYFWVYPEEIFPPMQGK